MKRMVIHHVNYTTLSNLPTAPLFFTLFLTFCLSSLLFMLSIYFLFPFSSSLSPFLSLAECREGEEQGARCWPACGARRQSRELQERITEPATTSTSHAYALPMHFLICITVETCSPLTRLNFALIYYTLLSSSAVLSENRPHKRFYKLFPTHSFAPHSPLWFFLHHFFSITLSLSFFLVSLSLTALRHHLIPSFVPLGQRDYGR